MPIELSSNDSHDGPRMKFSQRMIQFYFNLLVISCLQFEIKFGFADLQITVHETIIHNLKDFQFVLTFSIVPIIVTY